MSEILLININRENCRDGSTRYDLTFKVDLAKITTQTWCDNGVIHVTYSNFFADEPNGKAKKLIEFKTRRIIQLCEEKEWVYPILIHANDIARLSLEELEVETWKGAIQWGIDDASDERQQYGEDLERKRVYKMLDNLMRFEA